MTYPLLALAIALCLAHNVLTRAAHLPGDMSSVLRFNVAVALVVSVAALLLGGPIESPSLTTLLWGALYGLVSAANLISRLKALANGPMTATLLIGGSSMVISTVVGTALWHEPVSVDQTMGIALMLAAMALSLRRGGDGTATRRWPFWALGLFFTNALIGLIFKAHQSTVWAGQSHLLVSVGFAASALLLTLANRLIWPARAAQPDWRAWFIAALCGCTLCANNLLTTRLSGALPSVVFFPIYNGAVLVFSVPVSVTLFHERIRCAQLAGMVLAVAAILFIGGVITL